MRRQGREGERKKKKKRKEEAERKERTRLTTDYLVNNVVSKGRSSVRSSDGR